MLQMVAVCPHPPIIIPEIGKDERNKASKTINAMEKLAQNIKDLEPNYLVFITPHGAVFQDAITIPRPQQLLGSLKGFGSSRIFNKTFAQELSKDLIKKCIKIKAIVAELDEADAMNYDIKLFLDYGIMVPLHFLDKINVNAPILPINMGMLPLIDLYEFGTVLGETLQERKERIVLIVSGDFSHRLTKDAPGGFDPLGKVFDEIIVEALQDKDVLRILNMENRLVEKAGECGYRPLVMGLGALDGLEFKSEIFSYEGPFGVGYLVAGLYTGKANDERRLQKKLNYMESEKIKNIRNKESWIVKWARENLESYLQKGKKITLPEDIPEEFKVQKGVFVSLKKQGLLRGCIGTIKGQQKSIVKEVQENVLKAAFEDPRFEPVSLDELQDIVYSVDILQKPEKIKDIEELNAKIYGVIVKKGSRSGLLLPNLEGVNSVYEQIKIAKEKAGIRLDEDVEMERFMVTRFN